MLTVVLLSLFAVTSSLPTIYQFNAWKQNHGKVYHPDEETSRREIFVDNMKFIAEYNAREDTTMELGNTEYSDLTHEEFRTMLTGSVNDTNEIRAWMEKEAVTFLAPENFEAPSSVDWRSKGAVTPIKNQGACGSCYSFSSTGAIEGQWFRKNNVLISLSEQQIMDCSTSYGNNGCNGGLMTNSFLYVKQAGGIETEQSYPYEAQEGHCRFNTAYVGAKVRGYSNVPTSESALKTAVASTGPISVAIDASHRSLQFYTGGIYYEPACSSQNLDHAVMAVGYSSNSQGDYWIIKNSWGTGWGLSGYFWLKRNYNNHCGVASMASFPLV